MITGVHHIGIAVKDLDEALAKYTGVLGAGLESVHDMPETGTRLAFLSAGNTRLELLAPAGPDGRIARFIASHGEGLHHICLEVDDIQKSLDFLSARGIPLRDREPRQSPLIGKIAFLQPEAMNGVTIELVERPKEAKKPKR